METRIADGTTKIEHSAFANNYYIENVFLPKTVGHILKLEEVLSDEVFSRKDVIRVLGLKESRASGLIKWMEEKTSLKRYAGLGKENTDSDISMNELCLIMFLILLIEMIY